MRSRWREHCAAFALDSTLLVARYNLGVALMRQSRDDEGTGELNAFLDARPRGPEAAEAARFLENPRRTREQFAPDFSLVTLDQTQLSLDDLKGKVVLLDFLGHGWSSSFDGWLDGRVDKLLKKAEAAAAVR